MVNRITKGLGAFGRIIIGSGIHLIEGGGAPTDGTSGTGAGFAKPGSMFFDSVNGRVYTNTGTKASPAWTTLGSSDIINVRNTSGGTITRDSLVYISGWSETATRFLITKADADAGSARATYFLPADIVNNANGIANRTGRSAATLNTNAGNVADPVYLSTTAGGWTLTAPTAVNALQQVIGFIAIKSVTVGVISWDLRDPQKVGQNEIEANAVAAGQLALGADGALTPFPEIALQFTVADAATRNVDQVIAVKMVVTDVLVTSTGANGANANTVQLDNGITSNHITNAMSTNGLTAGQVVRPATLDSTLNTILAGATLRIIQTKAGGTHGFVVWVRGYLVA